MPRATPGCVQTVQSLRSVDAVSAWRRFKSLPRTRSGVPDSTFKVTLVAFQPFNPFSPFKSEATYARLLYWTRTFGWIISPPSC